MGVRFFAEQDSYTEELGKQKAAFERVKWEQQGAIKYSSFNEQVLSANAPDFSKLCSPKTITAERMAKIRSNYTTNISLAQLATDAGAGATDPIYWSATVSEPANGTLKFTDVKVVDSMHVHDVFKYIEFQDIIVTMRFDKISASNMKLDVNLYLETGIPSHNVNAPSISRYVGTNGKVIYSKGSWLFNAGEVSDKAQIGVAKNHSYYFKAGSKLLVLEANYTCTFLYPGPFEPMGVVSTMKVLPQVTFRTQVFDYQAAVTMYPTILSYVKDISTLISPANPADYDIESCTPSYYRARVKLTVNNNNTNHITYQNIGGVNYDANYLSSLRSGNHIPAMFEKVFLPGQPKNVLGFYSDSFYLPERSPYTLDTRKLPPYAPIDVSDIMPHELSPFWYTMFDYAKYNVQQEMQFMGVWRRNSKDWFADHNYATAYSFNPDDGLISSTMTLKYPDTTTTGVNEFKFKKVEGQGAYDNIHLHGYLGHYKDNNELVVHAPVCGSCCFHMHWRWGDKAYFTADSYTKLGMDSIATEASRVMLFNDNGFKYTFLGWSCNDLGVTKSNQIEGMPLVPPNQHIDIAVTNPGTTPATSDANVVGSSPTALDPDQKVIWYCATIEETTGIGSSHVVLEQGCGYAYDYNPYYADQLKTPSAKADPPHYYRQAIDNLGVGADATFLDAIWKIPFPIPPGLNPGVCSLSTSEMFEMQYRLMRFYNSGTYKNYDQMPTSNTVTATILKNIEEHY